MPALRAYLVSHLGKYVPGKAMVVVVRAGMVVPFGARASTAAIATFYETLVMMAAGGLIAAAGFALGGRVAMSVKFALPLLGPVELPVYRLAAVCGLGLGLAFLILVVPPVFGRLARLVSLPIPGVGPGGDASVHGPALGPGPPLVVVRLDLAGPEPARGGARVRSGRRHALRMLGLVPVVIASVALATVAGFVVAVLPGGLGVREGVLMSALAPALGSDQAVVAALVLRLVWVAAELVAAAVLFPWFRRPPADVEPPRKRVPITHDQRRRPGP